MHANLKVAGIAVCFVAGMVGLTYASVPLYELFCRVTGYGGTTQRADVAPVERSSRKMAIEFDANINGDLAWDFVPVQRRVNVQVGEERLAFYRATNVSNQPIVGTATFNVAPLKAGPYFSKIDCFCFEEQRLEPGQSVDMPVSFFVDPEIDDDPNLREVKTITLSYTFFESKADS